MVTVVGSGVVGAAGNDWCRKVLTGNLNVCIRARPFSSSVAVDAMDVL